MHCLDRALAESQKIGAFAVDVIAIDERANRLYVKYGFIPLEDHPHHLYLPMQTIEALFAGA